MQRLLAWPYRAILAFLIWTGVRPWQLTLLSPVFIVVGRVADRARQLARRRVPADRRQPARRLRRLGGAPPRRGRSAPGAFMDSVLDRVSDMILFSCLFWNLAAQGEPVQAALALLTLIVSLGREPDPGRGRGGRHQAHRGPVPAARAHAGADDRLC